VRSGRLEAIAPDGTRFGTIIPGEGFGELALLDRTPRTATVQAVEPTEVWSLGAGSFNRWVSDRYEVAARIRADRDERARLLQLPFFRGLSGQELDRIVPRLRTLTYAPGQAVVRAGDAPDGYYVIRRGTAEVSLPDGAVVRTLGPGDSFGELALLFGGPRTATVTALSELACARLSAADFGRLVRASGDSAGEIRARTAHYVGAGLGGTISAGA
jgi:cAMP-dependent protein kinase regulator